MRYFLIVLLSISIDCFAQTSITEGLWTNEAQDMRIQFYEKNNVIFGKLVWVKDSLDENGEIRRDIYNENPKLRSRKIIGIDVLTGLKGKRNGTSWNDGNYYYFDGGSDYNAIMYIENDVLYIKGYWWWFRFLGKTRKWTRYK
ncbi:MAG: DUF2147 domain-containing protein [Chitinophagales bacterium]|jgi:uncharacterized protein (DUF2147 family)|nr:DUF2147 domain-containing protein [Chitinophagales bacterium]